MDGRTIGIIGLGRMGEALVRGLANAGAVGQDTIRGYDVDKARCEEMFSRYGIKIQRDIQSLVNSSEVVLIAVKPDVVLPVAREVRSRVNPAAKLFISIAAGVKIASITSVLGGQARIVRAMPNVALIAGFGATAICRGGGAGEEDEKTAKRIFDAVGLCVVVKQEAHLDVVTGLSGSGPAFIYLMMDALCEGGVKCGLPRELADLLTRQTVFGSGALAVQDRRHFASLKDMVTTPAGTAITGIAKLEERAFRSTVMSAVEDATNRAREIGEALAGRK